MADRLEEHLEECLLLLRSGASVDECMGRYPADAAELRPLLLAAVAAQEELVTAMPADVQARVLARVNAAWVDRQTAPRRRWWSWLLPRAVPRWAAAVAVLVIVVGFGGTGTVAASGGALPGDAPYPGKELKELRGAK